MRSCCAVGIKFQFMQDKLILQVLLFSRSVMSDSVTPWTAACKASLSFTVSQNLLKLMPIDLVMPSNYLNLCRPFLLLWSVFPTITLPVSWLFASAGQGIKSFSFSISPSNEYSGLISFRIDWFDLAVQRITRVFFITTFQKHQFFSTQALIGQLSQPYMSTGKTITLTVWTFVSKVISLLFNTLSRFVIVYSLENKASHCFHFFPHLFAMK